MVLTVRRFSSPAWALRLCRFSSSDVSCRGAFHNTIDGPPKSDGPTDQARKQTEEEIGKENVALKPWKGRGGRYKNAGVEDCLAISIYANVLDQDFIVPDTGIITLGPGDKSEFTPVQHAAKLSFSEASKALAVIQEVFEHINFSGVIQLSQSQKTWNIWRGRPRRKTRRKISSPYLSEPDPMSYHPHKSHLRYWDGEWYHEDHF